MTAYIDKLKSILKFVQNKSVLLPRLQDPQENLSLSFLCPFWINNQQHIF